MAISSLGVGSGLDLNSIVSGLMQVEQQPLLALQKKEASVLSRISALGNLKGNLAGLQTAAKGLLPSSTQTLASKFSAVTASTGDSTIATASATNSAISGNYTLSNIKLASAEQIRKSATSLSIPAVDGTLSITVGTASAVAVDVKANATLSEVAQAINDASAGVKASIVNDGTTDHLVITANKSGLGETIQIDGSPAGWDSFDFTPAAPLAAGASEDGWTAQSAAASAEVQINGLLVTSKTNTISSSIAGVTITLLKESVAGTSLAVTEDKSSPLVAGLNSLVQAYNTAAKAMKDLGAYNAETKAAGALQGDAMLRTAQNQTRQLLQTSLGSNATYQSLSDIGINLKADGTLALDSTKLKAAISADFTNVTAIVEKVAKALDSGLENIVGSSGNITAATDSANRLIKQLDSRQEALANRLEQIQARYIRQFSALDTLVAGMKQTSSWLTQQLANLPGASSS